MDCIVVTGKVKREKGIAVVQLQSIAEAVKAENELQNKKISFDDLQEAAEVSVRRVPESARASIE